MYMTRAGLDAAELELRYRDSVVLPVHWGWVAREEWKLWAAIQELQRKVDDV